VVVQVVRPVSPITVESTVPGSFRVPGSLNIPWPSQGEAALAVQGEGLMGQSGGNTPLPIASLTKMMTAYLVLKAHPLTEGQDGPTLTVSQQDVQSYQQDVAQGDSVAKVAVGEKLTEYQLLEALLLPSGDNIATMLGNWVSGSTFAFVNQMNATAKSLGMNSTHYSDPAGVDPTTLSTAVDQVKIARMAMGDAVFRQIVAEPQAILPIAGTVYNVDYEVGHNGIVGIKTGSTPEDGASFAFASYANVGNSQVLVIGAVLGQHTVQSLQTALDAGVSLENAAKKNLRSITLYKPGQAVAAIHANWTKPVPATTRGLSIIGWPGMSVQSKVVANDLGTKAISAGDNVGHLNVALGDTTWKLPLQANSDISAPSVLWKLERVKP
jgi:serine-type D-Ala-D-Ala carboxypeptidase (penicillin-binding protein 5/6)